MLSFEKFVQASKLPKAAFLNSILLTTAIGLLYFVFTYQNAYVSETGKNDMASVYAVAMFGLLSVAALFCGTMMACDARRSGRNNENNALIVIGVGTLVAVVMVCQISNFVQENSFVVDFFLGLNVFANFVFSFGLSFVAFLLVAASVCVGALHDSGWQQNLNHNGG
jgi:hypothetical protein